MVAISFAVRPELSLVISRFAGRINGGMFVEAYLDILRHKDLKRSFDELCIIDSDAVLDIPFDAVKRVAKEVLDFNDGHGDTGRTVVVAADDVPRVNMDFYNEFSSFIGSPDRIAIYPSLGEAADALGRTERLGEISRLVPHRK